ncbi:MAG: SLBB domain-containing protein [Candidatus Izimaplasma sp.]|nr:SLBB domain-containing protein [Candidatus Izimaplasma bacterium]
MRLFKGNFGIVLIIIGIIGFIYFNNFQTIDDSKEYNQNEEFVDIKDNFLIKVEIKGEINIPGIYSVDANLRVVDLISLAGGLTINADTRTINRAQKLTDEMVIIIPRKENSNSLVDEVVFKYIDVEIRGEVKFPGVYQLNENAIVNDIVLKAGGLTKEANLFDINLAKKLQNGEQINISCISKDNETDIFVEIKGEINQPGVYVLDEGAIVLDLIEKAGGITENADTSNFSQVELLLNHQVIIVPSIQLTEEKTIVVDVKGEVNNPDVYYFSESLRVIDVINAAGGFTKDANYHDLNLSEIVNDEELVIIEKIPDSNNLIVVDLKGEVRYPGVYFLEKGNRVEDLIKLGGGFKTNANIDDINLAEQLVDEQVVIVTKGDYENIYIYVQISGEVMKPGIYALMTGSRMNTLINRAGGFTKYADTENINLTKLLSDEDTFNIPRLEDEANKIYISIIGEVKNPGTYYVDDEINILEAINIAGGLTLKANLEMIDYNLSIDLGTVIVIPSLEKDIKLPGETVGLININTANSEVLQTLNGIGIILAERIIEYRITHNGFNSIDEIMNVSGIKDSIYDQIKNDITV